MPVGLHREIASGGRDVDDGFADGRGCRHGSLGNRIQAEVAEAAGFCLLFIEGATLRTRSYQSSFCAAGALRDACILSAMHAAPTTDARDVANRTTHPVGAASCPENAEMRSEFGSSESAMSRDPLSGHSLSAQRWNARLANCFAQ